jgi:hypothetical protein
MARNSSVDARAGVVCVAIATFAVSSANLASLSSAPSRNGRVSRGRLKYLRWRQSAKVFVRRETDRRASTRRIRGDQYDAGLTDFHCF